MSPDRSELIISKGHNQPIRKGETRGDVNVEKHTRRHVGFRPIQSQVVSQFLNCPRYAGGSALRGRVADLHHLPVTPAVFIGGSPHFGSILKTVTYLSY